MSFTSEHVFEEVAIIAMSCRFPGSSDPDAFWEHLRAGRELISFFSKAELKEVDLTTAQNPHYIPAKGIFQGVEYFDAELFGYTPKEAQVMDPQHRILLECAWEALEKAGYHSEHYNGTIGVFVGCNPNSYFLNYLYPRLQKIKNELEEFNLLLGNGNDYLATKISYKLNLKGPSKTIQTACSTSLVAIHDACQSLLNFQCDMALSGGVSISFPHQSGYLYVQGGINSQDGHCRAFDDKATGTVFGDGAGLVVLKRLEDAIADGDSILAVIKGSAVNNDGAEKMSFFAPSIEGQSRVVAAALAAADISAEAVSYVETHGTGTALGDPVEVSALTKAFRLHTAKKGFCPIGSVKTNVGHLITAAGMASLIKTILMLKHREIVPSLHFEKTNSQIVFSETPFYVNTALKPWETDYMPRKAGVSSFGIGGTNAHIVLEEAPYQVPGLQQELKHDFLYFLPFSANTPSALLVIIEQMLEYLQHKPAPLLDIAYTLQVGRKTLPFRTFFVCHTLEDTRMQLKHYLEHSEVLIKVIPSPITFVWYFPQFIPTDFDFYQDLYLKEPLFCHFFDQCAQLLEKSDSISAKFPDACTLFSVQYAYAQVLRSIGHQPDILSGEGVGQYVVSVLLGERSLEHALKDLSSIPMEFSLDRNRDLGATEVDEGGAKKVYINFGSRGNGDAIDLIPWTKTKDSLQKMLYKAIGDLWKYGVKIDGSKLYDKQLCKRISLPTYPFAKTPHQLESISTDSQESVSPYSFRLNHSHCPGTLLEKMVSLIWMSVLQIEEVDPQDDFFAVGGDSLKALEVMDHLQEIFGVHVGLQDFLEYSTVKQMALWLQKKK